jgi:hypothetical protein
MYILEAEDIFIDKKRDFAIILLKGGQLELMVI